MTTATLLNHEIAQTGKTASAGLVERFQEWLRFNRDVRITVRELSRLSDRELNDLDIARCDIQAIAVDAVSNRQR